MAPSQAGAGGFLQRSSLLQAQGSVADRAPEQSGSAACDDRRRNRGLPVVSERGGREQSRPPFAFAARPECNEPAPSALNSAGKSPPSPASSCSSASSGGSSASTPAVRCANAASHCAAASMRARSAATRRRSSTASSIACFSGRSPGGNPVQSASAASERKVSISSVSARSASRMASMITEGRSGSSGRHPVAGHSRGVGARSAGSASPARIAAR